ncbi:hypothetical protein NliqN6_6259 [Naganishia liquefaciens]|uniref:DNA replication regulator SLD2 n=1 Tax=Naganishia liquefaciens TaxID=104408 RepID=A0A8H3TZ91_9TREE|nr:hypothetical protein NliqN6_6259 [Naganishia liquefaciens]
MPQSLAGVKAEIKTWERAFRAKHDRNPTRDDIKARRDIADKYTLYKKLVRAEAGEEAVTRAGEKAEDLAKGLRPDNSRSRDRQAKPPQGAVTVSINANVEEDQRSPFQTPKKNKTSDRWHRPSNPANDATEELLAKEPTPMASNPFLSPAKSTRQSSMHAGLKKAKGYPTPVSDPAHSNPFEEDVISIKDQGTPRKSNTTVGTSSKSPAQQAFLFAPSPKRLKSLLEVNSLHASSPREQVATVASPGKSSALPAVTPRTRARKRLRGEEVENTPEKERERNAKSLKMGSRWAQARTSRLRRSNGGEDAAMQVQGEEEGQDSQSVKRINVWKRHVQEESKTVADIANDMALSDDDDEVLGPTPVKNPAGQLVGGMSSGKRLFMDMLPPLDKSPHGLPLHVQGKPERNESQRTDIRTQERADDEIDTSNVARTPSKAMSRFLAAKPQTTESPRGTVFESEEVGSTNQMNISEDSTESQTPEDLSADTYVPDATDDGEEAIPVETVDLDELEAGVNEPNAQPERIPSQKALAKEVVLSDDEDGEVLEGEDAEMRDTGTDAPKGEKTLRIESYRYTLQQKVARQQTQRKIGIFDEQDIAEMQTHDEPEYEGESTDVPAPNQPDPFQALSQLTIQSPESKIIRKTMALQQARAKAIFDARAREQLRAAKRAPVYGAGEGMGGLAEDDQGAVPLHPFEDEGEDDDWESDPEGWKATGLPDDDDW